MIARRLARAALGGALLASGPGPLVAQEQLLYLPLDSATTVRLHLTDGRRIAGRLVQPFGPDSTRFVYCAGTRGPCGGTGAGVVRATPAPDVTRVDVRHGTRVARGATIGAGAAIGAAAVFCALTDRGGCDPAKGGFFSYVVLPTGLVGAGLGALIGSSVTVWAQAP